MYKGHRHEHDDMVITGVHTPKEVSKFVAIIAFIFAGSLLLTKVNGPITFLGWSRWFMGLFFLVFASFKFLGYRMFTMMFTGYDVIAKRYIFYAHLFPFLELGLGLAYIFNWVPGTRDLITLVIMAVSSIGVFQEIRKRSGIHCACLGNVIKLPLSTVSLVEDLGMGLMALLMLVLP